MSMLSSQCDELRQVAQVYRNLGKHATEQMLLDAADTILELRDDLQRANDSLRDAEHDESVAWDRVRKAERESAKLLEEFMKMDQWHSSELEAALAEIAKLRELATGLYRCWLGEGCDGCPMQDSDGWCIRDLQLRELRIEVSE